MVNFECVVILPRCKNPHVLKKMYKVLLIKFNNVYNSVPFFQFYWDMIDIINYKFKVYSIIIYIYVHYDLITTICLPQ